MQMFTRRTRLDATPGAMYCFHVMNETGRPADPDVPTPEQLAGRKLRLLRQQRGWSQQDVMERMRAYGYRWSHATVTRLEAATRPIRLNELADLAALYGVPVVQLLEAGAPDDLDALEREIEELAAKRRAVREHLDRQEALAEEAALGRAAVAAHLARIDDRLGVLMRWHPQFVEIAQGVHRKGDRRE
jgi:transcriptional regulator with XRE-family HTH domain